MAKVEVFYRDGSNYKFINMIEVDDALLKANSIKEGHEDVLVTSLGISEKEWQDPKYRAGYAWSEEDDHYLVDIEKIS